MPDKNERQTQAWHGCMMDCFEQAAGSVEAYEFGGAETEEEFGMTLRAAKEVARRIRSIAYRYSRKYQR